MLGLAVRRSSQRTPIAGPEMPTILAGHGYRSEELPDRPRSQASALRWAPIRRHSTGSVRLPGTSMFWSPATGPLPRVPRWRPALPPIMPTSTRCGEERNRSTRVWVRTGSPGPTGRTWSRPEAHPVELRRRRARGRHPPVNRVAVRSAPSRTRAWTPVVSGLVCPRSCWTAIRSRADSGMRVRIDVRISNRVRVSGVRLRGVDGQALRDLAAA
jgi:hypothetical protein